MVVFAATKPGPADVAFRSGFHWKTTIFKRFAVTGR